MKIRRCIALVRSRAHESLWLPCANAALPRDHFCGAHRDVLDGAILGLHAHRDPAEGDGGTVWSGQDGRSRTFGTRLVTSGKH